MCQFATPSPFWSDLPPRKQTPQTGSMGPVTGYRHLKYHFSHHGFPGWGCGNLSKPQVGISLVRFTAKRNTTTTIPEKPPKTAKILMEPKKGSLGLMFLLFRLGGILRFHVNFPGCICNKYPRKNPIISWSNFRCFGFQFPSFFIGFDRCHPFLEHTWILRVYTREN